MTPDRERALISAEIQLLVIDAHDSAGWTPERRRRAVELTRALNEIRARGIRRDIRALTSWTESETLASDLARLLNHLRDDEERLAAADRLSRETFKRPIYGARLPVIKGPIAEEADRHGQTPETELREQAKGRLFEAVAVLRGTPASALGSKTSIQSVRRRLNALLCVDFAGPGWRQPDKLRGSDLDRSAPLADPAADPGPVLRALLAGLSPRERELALLVADGKADSLADAGRVMGIAPSTTRVLAWKIRKKIATA